MATQIRPGSYAYKRVRKERLRREGRWQQFLEYRGQLKATGMTNADANKAADKAFAPGTTDPPTTPLVLHNQDIGTDDLIDESRFRQEHLSPAENIEWAAAHVADKSVQPEDAPNSAAWGLLRWARSKPDDFWKLYARRTSKQLELEEQALRQRDNKLLERAIEKCLKFPDPAIVAGAGQ